MVVIIIILNEFFLIKHCISDSTSSVPPEVDMNRPNSLKASNPFIVLNEGIAEALGVPMFERNIPPKE